MGPRSVHADIAEPQWGRNSGVRDEVALCDNISNNNHKIFQQLAAEELTQQSDDWKN